MSKQEFAHQYNVGDKYIPFSQWHSEDPEEKFVRDHIEKYSALHL